MPGIYSARDAIIGVQARRAGRAAARLRQHLTDEFTSIVAAYGMRRTARLPARWCGLRRWRDKRRAFGWTNGIWTWRRLRRG